MRLGLLGAGIQHSLSPTLYTEFLGPELEHYTLYDIPEASAVPTLSEFSNSLHGLSITTPYKKHFLPEVIVSDPEIRSLGAINCISFSTSPVATNTDYLALETLLPQMRSRYPGLDLVLLGDGVMASISQILFRKLGLHFHHLRRSTQGPLEKTDLARQFQEPLLVINACARSFVFSGTAPAGSVFWDYNYSFRSHSETLPRIFSAYVDGEELLREQALSAIKFWRETNPKLKC